MLRDYQQRAIDMCYQWMSKNDGNPCLVLPTGAGKSHIVAALCKDMLQNWPETRVLMLTHQKELIEQNAEKMLQHWPNAPFGIYSASVGKRNLYESITFAGIQSVRKKSAQIGHVDIIIIDECHLVNHKDDGGYRTLINELLEINSSLRIIGLSATPYRLGHGYITDKPAIFDGLIEPVTISWLINNGFLSRLRSKITCEKLSVDGVHRRGGDYIESELQAAVDIDEKNSAVVQEVISLAGDRKSWLFFCSGVAHADHIAEALRAEGITAECVTGAASKLERDRILSEFKSGKIRALTNANVLTTGFDAPCIDLIAMLRPTLSPGLYVQMAGRGLRVADGKQDCLVLDFAGVVETHGPIVAVCAPDRKKENEKGEPPSKACENCGEICHAAVRKCTECGAEFPEPEKKPLLLRDVDIMGASPIKLDVKSWAWEVYKSRASGAEMLRVTYYGALSDAPVSEYICIAHSGYAGVKAVQTLHGIAYSSGCVREIYGHNDMAYICAVMNDTQAPSQIDYKKDGKFYSVVERYWNAKT